MSDLIEIFGIEAFGYHGVFDHERRDGQTFSVDVALEIDLSKASQTDALSNTVDYGAVSNLVAAKIMGAPFNLIEKLAGVIASSLLDEYVQLQKVSVKVHKPHAPISVKFKDVAVTVSRTR